MTDRICEAPEPAPQAGAPGRRCSDSLLSPLRELLACLPDRSVILLRPLPTGFRSDTDDVDLLLPPMDCDRLLWTAFRFATAGRLHFHVRRQREEKTQLILRDPTGQEQLIVDLWTSVTQLGPWRSRAAISAETLRSSVDPEPVADTFALPASVRRLPPDIEFCLYLLHLARKRRSLSAPRVPERLRDMTGRLAEDDRATSRELAACAVELRGKAQVPSRLWLRALQILELRLSESMRSSSPRSGSAAAAAAPTVFHRRPLHPGYRASAVVRRWLGQRIRCFTVSGSDGIGKTTLIRRLADISPRADARVAKKLYRRSLLYQLAGGLIRRVCGWHRDRLDDRFAALITLRAAVALWGILIVRGLLARPPGGRTLLLDRSVRDFLIQNRKTDSPRWIGGARRWERLVPPTTTVLLAASWQQLQQRRVEMTAVGFDRCQGLLFEQACRSLSFDVAVFSTAASEDDTARVVSRCLNLDRRPEDASDTRTIPAGNGHDSLPASARPRFARRAA